MTTRHPAGSGFVATLAVAVLVTQAGVVGVWGLLGPSHFVSTFPGGGLRWIPDGEPYSEHLTRDVGALHLALLVITLSSVLGRTSSRVVGAAWLAFAIPHLAFHAAHASGLGAPARITSLGALGAVVLAAVALALGPERPLLTERHGAPPAPR